MKKTYINPTTNVTSVKIQYHLLAGSGVTTNGSGDVTSVGFGASNYDSSKGGALSRGGSVWDDED